jgi:type IV secretory pathway VirB3-like protein
MGGKLLWTGLTLIVAFSQFSTGIPVELVGAVIMLIGLVLLWLDK